MEKVGTLKIGEGFPNTRRRRGKAITKVTKEGGERMATRVTKTGKGGMRKACENGDREGGDKPNEG